MKKAHNIQSISLRQQSAQEYCPKERAGFDKGQRLNGWSSVSRVWSWNKQYDTGL